MISDLLKQKEFTFSCEIFPPQKGAELCGVLELVQNTAQLGPDFVSVTCGAGGTTAGTTREVARHIEMCGVTALAHVTCAALDKDQVTGLLGALADDGIKNILALRGDLPHSEKAPKPGHYQYASELVADIKSRGGFCIGGACYPEGHVESYNQDEDIAFLKEKVDAGCDFLATQMFFDNSVLYKFLFKLLKKDIDVPVVAGIMPVTNKKQIAKILEVSGTALPARFQNILDKFGDNPPAMQQAGIAYATEQITDLIANGVRGIHVYTMNKPEIAAKIMDNLSCII